MVFARKITPRCPKQRYPNEFKAAEQALAMARKGKTGPRLNVYRCPECDGFHWGHDITCAKPRRRQ